MTDVTIPQGVAKRYAAAIRGPLRDMCPDGLSLDGLADLLDPKPPTLRDEVARAWCVEVYGENSSSAKNPSSDQLDAADAVIALIVSKIEALPQIGIGDGSGQKFAYRVTDVDALFAEEVSS